MPAAGVSAPAFWMRSASFLIDLGTSFASGNGRSATPLNGCHEFDAAVTVPVVVPVDERGDPLTGCSLDAKGLRG